MPKRTYFSQSMGILGDFDVSGDVVLGTTSDNTVEFKGKLVSDIIPKTNNLHIGNENNPWALGVFNKVKSISAPTEPNDLVNLEHLTQALAGLTGGGSDYDVVWSSEFSNFAVTNDMVVWSSEFSNFAVTNDMVVWSSEFSNFAIVAVLDWCPGIIAGLDSDSAYLGYIREGGTLNTVFNSLAIGEICGDLLPGFVVDGIYKSTGGVLTFQVDGDARTVLGDLTGISINGVTYPVAYGPFYSSDDGSSGTGDVYAYTEIAIQGGGFDFTDGQEITIVLVF